MPPRPPPRLFLSSLELKKPNKSINNFTCLSCTLIRAIARLSLQNRVSHLQSLRLRKQYRYASTFASPATINKPLDIPVGLRELYRALEGLKRDAAGYSNLSRLQLALKGLDGRVAVRVAVLGFGDGREKEREGSAAAARRLVRLVCADALKEKGVWEGIVEGGEGGEDGRGLLLRFGEETDIPASNPLLQTIHAPSRILESHNLEILVATLRIAPSPISTPGDVGGGVQDSVLVPAVETPTSSSGRFSQVTYPMHKTILLGEGAKSLIAYGKFTASLGDQGLPADTVKLAVNIPGLQMDVQESNQLVAVDLDLAERSLALFRESLSNAVLYEEGWYKSGMPALSEWLLSGTTASSPSTLKPTVHNLISSVVEDTAHQIDIAAREALTQSSKASSISESTRASLLATLSSWAEKSHTELRDQLDTAFASAHWRRLKWYKLFWRVDDVSMITSEILERRWLTESEQSLIFLAGRVAGAGILAPAAGIVGEDMADITAFLAKKNEKQIKREEDAVLSARPIDLFKADVDAVDEGTISPIGEITPWPMHIPITRRYLAAETVSSMQALAQKLVLQTLSTTSLTAAISALAYVSVSSTSLYEAGAVAAFGFVLSLKRMQNKWEGAREYWEREVREEGRKALKETEEGVRGVVLGGEREVGVADREGNEDREAARKAVERVREALERVGK
ncbi:hypothetical protein EJ08DRAFT_655061 [Tothia fuscella]|uniref:Mmc1 C-terminal domain-containing protein n=1 Tax=Tothia fuscella TaxID=1048955 RepID=A0A9P4P271_9PEZI|nr:hypothetical protein EJ08DRAFT_655061 [Tothia fuscella]